MFKKFAKALGIRRGPQKPPKRWDDPNHVPQKLFSRDFILLFLMAMCSNSLIAVYYCFEQWLQEIGIPAGSRGLLISSLFAMILFFRPISSVVMLRHGKLWPMVISLAVCCLVMPVYAHIPEGYAFSVILGLRIAQGIALAVYSACTVGVLVDCIPPGQSARGFALFSLTMLLPYSIIPAVSEELLPIVGGAAQLFGLLAWLGVPSFLMLALLAKRLRKPEIPLQESDRISRKELLHSIIHSGLALVYLASLSFGLTTMMAVLFMKGLCTVTGEHPATFFTTYSIVIILVRVFGSRLMDTLPRHKVTIVTSLILGCCMVGFTLEPAWLFIPVSCVYGLSLGLLYPLLAAAVYDRSTPATRSINSNVMMATFDASGMLAPIVGGLVISAGWGYRGVFAAGALIVAFCAICMWLDGHLRRRLKKNPQRQNAAY